MDILQLFGTLKTSEQAVDYLETVRWQGLPTCPYCQSEQVGRHASSDRMSHRWQCRACSRAFAVTVGTIFHRTHVPLHKWFRVIALTLQKKPQLSAYQIAEYLSMRRPTVSTLMQKIRTAMERDPQQAEFLYRIVDRDTSPKTPKARKKRSAHVRASA